MRRSSSYDETQFRLQIVEKSYSANIVQYITPDDVSITTITTPESFGSKEPFSIHDPNDDDSSDDSYEYVLETHQPVFNHMFEPEIITPLEYERCAACGKTIIVGEEGDYHPKIGTYLCYPFKKNSCQQVFSEMNRFSSDIQKTIILREMSCHLRPTKRRIGMTWCQNVNAHNCLYKTIE